MTNIIEDYATHSAFAQAAYGDFLNVVDEVTLRNALLENNLMTVTQATNFASRYEIVAHQPNTEIEIGSEGGFSATVFRDKQTDELIFAVRGTEFPNLENGFSLSTLQKIINGGVDLISDIFDIGYDGLAVNQIADLYNFYLRLSAKTGEPIYQYEYDEIDIGGSLIGAIDFDNWEVTTLPPLSEDGPLVDKTFTVAGHSLGGHIASAFSRLAPSAVEAVYTYNAPGFDNILPVLENQTEPFFQTLHDLELQTSGSSNIETSGFVHQNLFNIVVEADLVSDIGTVTGERIVSFSEPEGVIDTLLEKLIIGGKSHSIASLTDALNVLNLMYQIQPSFTVSEGNLILQSISNIKSDDTVLESLLDSFIKLLSIDKSTIDVEDIYTSINAIKEKVFVNPDSLVLVPNPEFQNLTISSLTTTSNDKTISFPVATLKAAAQNSIAYRYTLQELNTFVITGNDSIYDIHNQPDTNGVGPLDLYDPNTNTGTITELYLTDRAKFLELKIQLGLSDEAGTDTGFDYYEDKATGFIIKNKDATEIGIRNNPNFVFGSDETDVIEGNIDADHLFGGAGHDKISGGAGNDIIEGNIGDDTLIGGKGADTLLGGAGFDRYLVTNGDFVSDDNDGEGLIQFRRELQNDGFTDTTVTTGIRRSTDPANTYKSADEQFTYTLSGTTLSVTIDYDDVPDHTITVLNYVSGDLGINLINAGDEQLIGTDNVDIRDAIEFTRRGDPEGIYLDTTLGDAAVAQWVDLAEDVTQQIVELNNEISDLQQQAADILMNDPLADVSGILTQIENKEAEIIVQEEEFDQRHLRLLDQSGGSRPTFIETLAGRATVVLLDEIGFTNTVVDGGDGNNFLSSGDITSSELTVIGFNPSGAFVLPETNSGQGNTLLGGGGLDIILGGSRNDVIEGGDDDDVLQGRGGNDRVFGGVGRDFVSGSIGNDILTGDGGMDVLTGGRGNDILDGGDDDDDLYGDSEFAAFFRGWTRTLVQQESGAIIRTYEGLFRDFSGIDDETIGGDDRLFGGAGDDYLEGGAGDDTLFGGDDNDILQGDNGITDAEVSGNDQLYGEGGKDSLIGGLGNDLLDGGVDSAQDLLKGGKDNDTYQYGFGYGVDAIDDESGSADKIKLLGALTANDVELKAIGGDLQLILNQDGNPTGDILIVNGWFKGEGLVETIEFSDGTIWDQSTIEEKTGVSHDPIQDPTVIEAYFVGNKDADVGLLTPNNDLFYGLGGRDILAGGSGDDRLFGGEGNDELQGNNDNDELYGEEGNDTLFGQLGNDVLDGGAGDDTLFGNEGNDTLSGGVGEDGLNGGSGNDTYLFNRGDGDDLILDSAGNDRLVLGAGITVADISVQRNGNDLVLQVLENGLASPDIITLGNWFIAGNEVETILFDDGTSWDTTAIQALLPDEQVLINNKTTVGSDKTSIYRFQPSADIPDGFNITINDVGGIDTLLFEQATSGSFSATPVFDGFSRVGNDLIINLEVDSNIGSIPGAEGEVRIIDYYTQAGFIETIEFPSGILNNPNFSPILNDTAHDQIILSDMPFSYQLDVNSFTDDALDLLNINATLSDGSALPTWLVFDATTLTFSGTPTIADSEIIDISVTATDSANQTVSLDFNLNVGNVNLAPEVATEIEDQVSRSQRAFSFQVPIDTFADVNLNETLTFSASLSDGSALPSWLTFDDVTGTFSGTPADVDIGSLDIRVIATDSGGLSASDVFTLTTNEFNSDPVAVADTYKDILRTTNVLNPEPEILVSTDGNSNDDQPVVTALSGGGFVIAYSNGPIKLRVFDDTGSPVSAQITASSAAAGSPSMTSLTNGGFVVTWGAQEANDPFIDIVGQMFDAAGNKIGSEFLANTNTENNQRHNDVAALSDGGFVVTWTTNDPIYSDSGPDIVGQRYDSGGNLVGMEFSVNDPQNSSGLFSDVFGLSGGGFIVAWEGNDGTASLLRSQIFDSNGDKLGNEFVIGSIRPESIKPDIVELNNGNIVVVYTSFNINDNVNKEIVGQIIDKNGNTIGNEFFVNTSSTDTQQNPSITALDDGGFFVTYVNNAGFGTDSYFAIVGQLFNENGDKLGEEFLVNQLTEDIQIEPSTTALVDGSIVVTYESQALNDAPTNNSDIGARIFRFGGKQGLPITVDVLANDSDLDAEDNLTTFSLDTVTLQGTKGTVSIEDHKLVFNPGTDFNDLLTSEQETITIDYTMSDIDGNMSSSTATIIIRGSKFLESENFSSFTRLLGAGAIVNSAGDINGDGFADLIVANKNNNSVSVVFGQTDEISSTLDLTSLDGTNGFNLTTANTVYSISNAGDINGDGLGDIIIGDPFRSLSGYSSEGSAYVVFGQTTGFSSNFDLNSLNGSNGFSFAGTTQYSYVGRSVSSAGDINGDGFDDLIFSAPGLSDTPGESYVVFGKSSGFNASLDLSTFNSSDGIRITGPENESSDMNVNNLGDINSDGFDDIIVTVSGQDSVEAYIVYGKNTGFSDTITLSSLDQTTGLRITGFGYSYSEDALIIGGAGDINGDGINDVIIGDAYANDNSGVSYVVFGSDDFGAAIDISTLDGTNGFRVDGENEEDISGSSVDFAGDINGDGFDDLIIGAPRHDPLNIYDAGASYVVFGKSDGFSPIFDTSLIDGSNGFKLFGANTYDYSGASVSSVGDVNGDGFDDLLVGAEGEYGDGDSFLIYGKDFRNEVEILGTAGDDIIDVIQKDLSVVTLDGDDTINLGPIKNVFLNTGRGNNTINFDSSRTSVVRRATIRSSSSSSNNINIGSNSRPVTRVINGRFILTMPGYNGGGSNNSFDIYTGNTIGLSGIRIRRGSLIVDIDDGFIELHFTDVNTNNLSTVEGLFERITFNDSFTLTYQDVLDLGFDFDGTDGDDHLFGTQITDRINGFGGNDTLDGGQGNDTLDGGQGDDTLDGGEGSDILIGNSGDDELEGGPGDDNYIINANDGDDIIADIGGTDNVIFGTDLSVTDLAVSQSGDDLLLNFNNNQTITFTDWFDDPESHIEQFIFTDNNLLRLTGTDIEGLIQGNTINLAPGINTGLDNQIVDEDAPFSYVIAADAFIDSDSNEPLSFTATLANGDQLPTWLSFDEQTKTFSGLAENDNVGDLEVEVTTTDNAGASVSDVFRFIVENTNDAPVLQNSLLDQNTDQEEAFSFSVPDNSFGDDDNIHGDQLTFSARLSSGSVLPSWLLFDVFTQTFSGIPGATDVGTYDITVIATDNEATSANDTFTFTVNSTSTDNVIDGTNSSNTINGTPGNDVINGLGGHDTINGLEGNDIIIGGTGQDTLNGGAGDDTFSINGTDVYYDKFNGGDGIDIILGGDGDDTIRVHNFRNDDTVEVVDGGLGHNVIAGNASSNIIDVSNTQLINIAAIDGGAGHDTITGNSDNNIIIGGTGQDTLNGGAGDDTFSISGADVHYDKFNGGAGIDTILGSDGDDTIRVHQFRNDDTVEIIDGGLGNNVIAGNSSSNIIDVSNTQLINIAAIDGGAGHDTITGNTDNNIIIGGSGQDTLSGGAGDDVYHYALGDSIDKIFDSFGNNDSVLFNNISHEQLWFWQLGDDLRIGILNTTDKLTIEDWYSGSNAKVETFNTHDDNFSLVEMNVQQLVDAMAAFSVSNSGSLDVPQNIQDDVQSVITTSWQAA